MTSSYVLYCFTVLFSSFCASLAQKFSFVNRNGNKKPNIFFWYLSMFTLIFIMGFRTYNVGVDGENYILNYNLAKNLDLSGYYSVRVTEPGFYLLNRLIIYFFDDYQWLFIISAAITIFFFYKAIEYEANNLSLALTIFIFASTQYFYFFGITRMGIAVSIVAASFRYILENKPKKYIFSVLVASLFHYSAPFALIALFVKTGVNERYKKKTILKVFLLIPLAFSFIRFFIYPLISVSRYQGYIENVGTFNLGFISTVPFFILFLIFYEDLINHSKSSQFYFILFTLKVSTEIFAPMIGIGRMVWYLNLSLCYLLAITLRINKNYFSKYVLLILIILYCLVYSYYSYFGDSFRGMYMIPYENIFFDFN